MSYISWSEGPSVSGYDVQGPKSLPKSAFDSAEGNISSSVVLEVPNSVIIQGVGNANFKYDCTTAIGSGLDGGAMSSSKVVYASGSALLTLPISPCAVSASGNINVTFVYRGGL